MKPWRPTAWWMIALAGAVGGCDSLALGPPVEPRKAAIDAMWTLRQAVEDADGRTRARALEVLVEVQGRQAGPVFLRGLKDRDPAVRFAAAMAIGEVQYAPAQAVLAQMSQAGPPGERDKRVYCAVVYALHRLGDDRHTRDLGTLLFDGEVQVRSDAAMVLGRMRVPAAVSLLRSALADELAGGREGQVKFNVLEALARLGDARSRATLEAYTRQHSLDYRVAAIGALGASPTPRAAERLRGLLDDPFPQIRVAAAAALGQMGQADERAYRLCLQALRNPKKLFDQAPKEMVRYTPEGAAEVAELGVRALGWMNRPQAASAAHPLLSSPQGGLRVAAAGAILRLLPAPREAE